MIKKNDLKKNTASGVDVVFGANAVSRANIPFNEMIPSSCDNSSWHVKSLANISKTIKKPVLIAGMPGIGNVGKIAMDVLIEETKAVPIMSFFSFDLPNSVFVNENNIVELPKIGLYYKRLSGRDFLFLTGDVQPQGERSSYEFCELIIDIFAKYDGSHILTVGGIGLNEIPDSPKVYITGNNKKFVNSTALIMKKKNLSVEKNIYGMVGPILGVSGLLLGLSAERKIDAYSLLAETYGHPIYVGLKGSKAILNLINAQYTLKISLKKIEKEIVQIDNLVSGDGDVSKKYRVQETNYIG